MIKNLLSRQGISQICPGGFCYKNKKEIDVTIDITTRE